MDIGVLFPYEEFDGDPMAIRDFAQTAEGLGFTHILAPEHVVGVNPARPGWQSGYTAESPFLEPFVLLTYIAAVTRELRLVTSILILPQRQTALVAKQAATLDVICHGRLCLGVGLGWNEVEYQALNQDFHMRGQRIQEQVEVLRQLWTQPLVTFAGRWDTIPDAGLNPLPIQRPIPIWFGAFTDQALKRAARIADGWLSATTDPEEAKPQLEVLNRALQEAGRSPERFGVELIINYDSADADRWQALIREWQALGVTRLALKTKVNWTLSSDRSKKKTPAEHIAAITHFAHALGPLSS